jgi:hypothetical protein
LAISLFATSKTLLKISTFCLHVLLEKKSIDLQNKTDYGLMGLSGSEKQAHA